MKKLEDIPKKDHFSAPEGYFETLPGRISARIEQKPALMERSVFRYTLQYTLPVLVLCVLGVVWFSQPAADTNNTDDLFATIETSALIEFLADAETTSYEDFLNEMNPSLAEADSLENVVYGLSFPGDEMEDLLDEIEINNL
ncbi:hypothetical protein SanaruYs_01310 [Chryseotalea sanaruensis]|uniref:Uncharacterized protein n=1 Tax=Chryseotalea sanaruensis TaxID=2482724 RepID=A0A401U4S9_9BACT|nr:hypothetical protein [Chryseotalea sanaruensis]GCC49917.1 hypothetical protein SanaruYs_01310 [Chryseotalea sanaruensis]